MPARTVTGRMYAASQAAPCTAWLSRASTLISDLRETSPPSAVDGFKKARYIIVREQQQQQPNLTNKRQTNVNEHCSRTVFTNTRQPSTLAMMYVHAHETLKNTALPRATCNLRTIEPHAAQVCQQQTLRSATLARGGGHLEVASQVASRVPCCS